MTPKIKLFYVHLYFSDTAETNISRPPIEKSKQMTKVKKKKEKEEDVKNENV